MKNMTKISAMPVLLLMIALSSFTLDCRGEGAKTQKNIVAAGANIFFSSAASYRQIYGRGFMPEFKFTRLVHKSISVWGACAWISKQGFIEEVSEPATIRQTLLSFGAGYVAKLNARLQVRAEAGMTFVSFKEEALARTIKGSGAGWKLGANLDCFIWKKVFAFLGASFFQAGDEAETGNVKLGGFQLGAGGGFAF